MEIRYCPTSAANLAAVGAYEFSRWHRCVIGISRAIVCWDSTEIYAARAIVRLARRASHANCNCARAHAHTRYQTNKSTANDALRNYSSPFTVPYRKGTLLAFNRTLRTADASNMYLVKRYSFAKVSSFRATASRRIEYPTTYHRNLLRSGIGNCCIPNDGAEANETLCGVDRIARNFFPI